MSIPKTNSLETYLMCMGSKIPPSFACLLHDLERPKLEGVRWVENENLFVGFQNFYKKKMGLDLRTLAPNLRENIYHEFFPLLIKAREVELTPNSTNPKALKIKFSIASLRQTTDSLYPQVKLFSESIRELLKTTSAVYQSFECDLQITLAHIGPKALNNPNFKTEIERVQLEGAIKEPFYLDKLFVVEVNKTDSGLKYTYKPLLEV